jgi:hypothetical protein
MLDFMWIKVSKHIRLVVIKEFQRNSTLLGDRDIFLCGIFGIPGIEWTNRRCDCSVNMMGTFS